ncbi:nucleotidyltransferase domain-containing protein [Pseudoduganella umbonata]|uniref:Nucleotidyltransferase n=1 Tax=Pseudoduganella umbonata TaxID=864828 RepID=A0A4P8HWH1_9BURK|nr:nucleotidyltransferase [Pseudoduganella umbonata]MBB3224474.1 hypothetical protein [Pseudoduganella umbonata]QCP13248.1 nucleotidyltransferase [Pseudoduganella umbonata]
MSAVLVERSREYSNNATSHFLQMVEHIGRALEPTATQLQALERSYTSTSDFLVECEEFESLLIEVHPQGSREIGTLVRPMRSGDGFDIDLVARFASSSYGRYAANQPGVLIDKLYSATKRYAERHKLELQRWPRCVTLTYADGMCADIAPVIDHPSLTAIYGESHGLIPDRDLKTLNPTNPKGFTRLFNDVASIEAVFTRGRVVLDMVAEDYKRADVAPLADAKEVFGRLLCRLIQLIKLHRDAAFASVDSPKDDKPSSIFLTALACEGYRNRARIPHLDELDLLLDIVKTMPNYIRRTTVGDREYWTIDNPTAPGDNLASAMNESSTRQSVFRQWHARLVSDISAVVDAIDDRQGIDQVSKLVKSAFGDRASKAAIDGQLRAQQAQRQRGQVQAVSTSGIIVPMTSRSHTFFGR